MDAFLNPTRRARWPEGPSRLHVYLLPDLTLHRDLAALIGACRNVLASYREVVQIVGGPWLHTTAQMIARPAADVTGDPRRQLTDRLRHHLSSLVPFQLSCGSPPATQSSVLLHQDGDGPVGPFTAVHTRVRQAIRDVLSDDVLRYDTMPPHLTLGYGTGPTDSGRIGSAVRTRVRTSHAVMTVDAVRSVPCRRHPAQRPGRLPVGMGGPHRSRRPAPDHHRHRLRLLRRRRDPDVDRVCAWPPVPGFV